MMSAPAKKYFKVFFSVIYRIVPNFKVVRYPQQVVCQSRPHFLGKYGMGIFFIQYLYIIHDELNCIVSCCSSTLDRKCEILEQQQWANWLQRQGEQKSKKFCKPFKRKANSDLPVEVLFNSIPTFGFIFSGDRKVESSGENVFLLPFPLREFFIVFLYFI